MSRGFRPRRSGGSEARLPFASGLAGGDLNDQAELPAEGMALLTRIRAFARSESAALEPSVRRQFDGSEYRPADPAAVEAKELYDAIAALVGGVNADKVLQLRIAALLARWAGRRG